MQKRQRLKIRISTCAEYAYREKMLPIYKMCTRKSFAPPLAHIPSSPPLPRCLPAVIKTDLFEKNNEPLQWRAAGRRGLSISGAIERRRPDPLNIDTRGTAGRTDNEVHRLVIDFFLASSRPCKKLIGMYKCPSLA